MRPRTTALLAVLTVVPALPAAVAVLEQDDEPEVIQLRPGESVDCVLDPLADDYTSYRITVPSKATTLRLWTTDASGDVELYVNYDTPPVAYLGEYGVASSNTWLDDELLIDVTDYYSLEGGLWFVQVAPSGAPAAQKEHELVTCTLHCEMITPEVEPLAIGETVQRTVHRDGGLRAVFEVEIPDDLDDDDMLRVEAFAPYSDVDVTAGPESRSRTLLYPYHESYTTFQYERFLLPVEKPRSRGLHLHVYAPPAIEPGDEVTLTVRVSRVDDPETICPRASLDIPAGEGPVGAALRSVVGVWGPLGSGSGVIIDERGIVLTNAHVVTGVDAPEPGDEIAALAVGFHRDARVPAVPEFGARILDYREDLDLALLQIVGDLGLDPLPAGATFPALERADLDALQLGDDLYAAGYPMTGGSGSLVTLTLTRGILSGWSLEPEGEQIKTDAGIHSGVSGGACLSADGRLVGTTSASISDANASGGLGFVIPTSSVPASWWTWDA